MVTSPGKVETTFEEHISIGRSARPHEETVRTRMMCFLKKSNSLFSENMALIGLAQVWNAIWQHDNGFLRARVFCKLRMTMDIGATMGAEGRMLLTRQRPNPDWGCVGEELLLWTVRHAVNKAHWDESLLHQRNWTARGPGARGLSTP